MRAWAWLDTLVHNGSGFLSSWKIGRRNKGLLTWRAMFSASSVVILVWAVDGAGGRREKAFYGVVLRRIKKCNNVGWSCMPSCFLEGR